MKIMLIDNSVVSYRSWHVMHSKNYEAETGLELAEYARNYAKDMLFLHSLIQPDRTYILLDCPREDIWRHTPYNKYYHDKEAHNVYFYNDEWYAAVDDKVYRMVHSEDTDQWVSIKLKKADQPAFTVDDEDEPKDLNLTIAIADLLPGYKKGRKVSRWDYETSREEYKQRASTLAKNFAPLIKGVAVEHGSLEADDLAHCVISQFDETEHQFVCVTSDSDWQQLCTRRKNVEVYDPIKHEMKDIHCGRAAHMMWVKLIGGDSADGIPGIRLNKSKSQIGPARAKKLVDTHGLDGIFGWLKENAYLPALERNLELISFKHLPAPYRKGVRSFLWKKRPSKVRYGLEKFGVTEAAKSLVVADAERQRMALKMKDELVS